MYNTIDNEYFCCESNYCVIAINPTNLTTNNSMCHRTISPFKTETKRTPATTSTKQQIYTCINQRFVKTVERHRLWQFIAVLTCLLLIWDNCIVGNYVAFVHAAPQSCILCDKDDLKTVEPPSAAASAKSAGHYEEFLFEHQVTRQDAIQAFKRMNQSDNATVGNSCKTVVCTKKVMKYCSGPQFINDHCLCELGHIEEGLPFVPHICYVGEKIETPSVGSCFFYEEVKDCCCAPSLAKEWRHISVASKSYHQHYSTVLKALILSIAVLINK